jgi:hypothetical protein
MDFAAAAYLMAGECSKTVHSGAFNFPRNMLKDRAFIHVWRIPLRPKTRYHGGKGSMPNGGGRFVIEV